MSLAQYPQIDSLVLDTFANGLIKDPLDTMITSPNGAVSLVGSADVKFLTSKNVTLLTASATYSSAQSTVTNTQPNINSDNNAVNDEVKLLNGNQLSIVTEFQYKVDSSTDASTVGTFSDAMDLELSNPDTNDVNNAKILNKGNCSLDVSAVNMTVQENKRYSSGSVSELYNANELNNLQNLSGSSLADLKLNAAVVFDSDADLKATSDGVLARVHVDNKATVQVSNYVSSDPLQASLSNEGYVMYNGAALSNGAAMNYDQLLLESDSSALPKKWPELDVLIITNKSEASLDSTHLELDTFKLTDNSTADHPDSLEFTVSRDAFSVVQTGSFLYTSNVDDVKEETQGATMAGHTSDDLVVSIAPNPVKYDNSNNSLVVSNFSVDYSKAPESVLSSENVSYSLSKSSDASNEVFSSLQNRTSSGSLSNDVFSDKNIALYLVKGQTVKVNETDIDPNDAYDQTKEIVKKDGSGSLNVGSVDVSGSIPTDEIRNDLCILLQPNADLNAEHDPSYSSSDLVKSAQVDLSGFSNLSYAGYDDIWDAANQQYHKVVTSFDSSEDSFRCIFKVQVAKSYRGTLLQSITAVSNLENTPNKKAASGFGAISVPLNADDYTSNVTTTNNQDGSKKLKLDIQVNRILIGGVNYQQGFSPVNGFFKFSIEALYDSSNNLVSGQTPNDSGIVSVAYNITAHSHLASFAIEGVPQTDNNHPAVPIDLRDIPKDFQFQISSTKGDFTVTLATDASHRNVVDNDSYCIPLLRDAGELKFNQVYNYVYNTDADPSEDDIDGEFSIVGLKAELDPSNNKNVLIKDSNGILLTTIQLNVSVYNSANSEIWVLSRPLNNWRIVQSIGGEASIDEFTTSNTSSVYNYAAPGANEDWLSMTLNLSAFDQAGNTGNNIAVVSLNKDLYSVQMWSGNTTISSQPIPSDLELDVGNDFTMSLTNYRGYAQGDSLTIKRAKVKVSRGGVDKLLEPLYFQEDRVADSFMSLVNDILPINDLKMILAENPLAGDSASTAVLTTQKPQVKICVNKANGENLIKAIADNHSKLQFSNMTWSEVPAKQVGDADYLATAAPFTSMFSLKNMLLQNDSALKLSLRSAKMYVTRQVGVSNATDGQTSDELLVSMNSQQNALFVGNSDNNSNKHGLSLWKSDANDNFIFNPISGYVLALPVMYQLDYVDGSDSINYVDKLNNLLNDANESTGAKFNNKAILLTGVTSELDQSYSGSALSYNLTVVNNKFSIRAKSAGSPDSDYVVLVDSALLSSNNFVKDGDVWKFTYSDGVFECKLSFNNALQRPIGWGPSPALSANSSKTIRFNSWHLNQVNDNEGNRKLELVRLASASFAIRTSGADNGSIDSSLFKDFNGMKVLKLKAVSRQVMEVNGDDSALNKLSIVSVFDNTGNSKPQWPGLNQSELSSLSVIEPNGIQSGMQEDQDPDMSELQSELRMATVLVKDKNTFDNLFNKHKTNINKTYRIVLQDLMRQHDHEGNLVMRVDPAGGIHTNSLYFGESNVVNSDLLELAEGLNVSGN